MNVAETAGELGCSWQYRTELFEGETIARMQGQFERLLESIVREPEARVSGLELEMAAEVAAQEQREAAVAESLRKVVAAATANEAVGEELAGFQLSQQQLVQWRSAAEVDHYVEGVVRLEGELEVEGLAQAWQQVMARHEILRTAFRRLPGMELPLQVVGERSVLLREIDLRGLEREEQERKLEEQVAQQRQQGFKLEQGRVVQARVVRLEEKVHVLLVRLSALCGDRQSLQNLVTELAQSYAAQEQGGMKPGEVLQYADYCAWQQELLSTEEGVEAGAYWEREVERAGTVVKLPGELKGRAGAGPGQVERPVGPEVRDKLVGLGERAGVSVSEVLLGAWQVLLWRLSGAKEVGIECEFSGRKYAELSVAIGAICEIPAGGGARGARRSCSSKSCRRWDASAKSRGGVRNTSGRQRRKLCFNIAE